MATSIWWFLCGVVVLWVLGAVLVIASAFWVLSTDPRGERPPMRALDGYADAAVETHSWVRVLGVG
jgi:hypothetical protein